MAIGMSAKVVADACNQRVQAVLLIESLSDLGTRSRK